MALKKRLNFLCCHCEREFSLFLEISDEEPKLTVTCPFCYVECIADLNRYRNSTSSIFRSIDGSAAGLVWNLPSVLPTTKGQ